VQPDGEAPPADVLEGAPPGVLSRWRDRARRCLRLLPRRRRRALSAGAAGVAALLLLPAVLGVVRAGLAERVARGEVALGAALGITVWSSTDGGRVAYHAELRNLGRRAVQVRAVDLAGPRLVGGARAQLPVEVAPGGDVPVPLSVRLDCAAPPVARPSPPAGSTPEPVAALRLLVRAAPADGRERRLDLPLAQADALVTTAATLCRVRPGSVRELSGPVRSRPGGW
jgi:hypothetical protein